ncbi:MAG: citrate/2-methylcitrate synthase [Actinomycetota bacterium]|nr:citrate synthase [Actinomycetota bacterium]
MGKGLEDVIAAQTSISDIDGKQGRLFYVGYDIHDLAPNCSFEEIIFLLHDLRLPNTAELEDLTDQLAHERDPHAFIMDLMPTMVKQTSPMSMLRTTVSAMSAYDPDGWLPPQDELASKRKAIRLIATIPTVIATYDRLRNGNEIVRPNPKFGHAGNLLWMLTGVEPTDDDARILDICLVLHADHTMNASTFAARVAASTLSDIHSACTAAIATLKGPLHGGANEAVMKMLLEIDDVARAEEYIKQKLAHREKIMGFGHRVYKTEDPRATHLRALSKQVGEARGETKWYEISRKIEEVVMQEKGLYPNVDFYAASVYYSLGIPVDLFTPVFAASRTAGWTAHVREQYSDNRLIRPESDYVGPRNRTWVPIEERG